MSDHIQFIDGKLIELGPSSTNAQGFTEWDYIKVELTDGSDRFLSKNRSGAKMSSYLREAIGQQVRVYFVELEIAERQISGSTVLAVEMESGKRYSIAPELDGQMKTFKRSVFLLDVAVFCLAPLGILLLFTIICIPVSLALFWTCWKILSIRPALNRSIKIMPTDTELSHFINSNIRDFKREQSALVG